MPSTNIPDGEWVSYLQRNNVIENIEERTKREKVVILLNTIVPNFQRKVEKHTDYKRGDIECILSPFGSYGLGGYIRNADIDLVLLCPWIVRRQDFYSFFPELLKQHPTVRDVEVIRQTAVPIIKCTIDSISIDISFVRLRMNKLPPDLDLLDDNLLSAIDDHCRASMDGPRVNRFILNHIKSEHLPVFRISLQCVKHWATQRDIYSKPCGYLNGSTWTFLLFKTYLVESSASNSMSVTSLLYSFFDTWANWPWQTPVLFTNNIPGKNGEPLAYADLTEFDDAVMPIVSPCYPVSGSAPFVTRSTLKVMTREFHRAQIILSTPTNSQAIFHKLFNQTNYFKKFNDFICITTTSLTAGSHDIWTRRMTYAVPQLLSLIESNSNIKHLQAMVKPFVLTYNYKTTQERMALQNGMSPEEAKTQSMVGAINPGILNIIYSFVGIKLEDGCTNVDLTEEMRAFLIHLEGKRNKKDEDVKWSLNMMRKVEVAKILGVFPAS